MLREVREAQACTKPLTDLNPILRGWVGLLQADRSQEACWKSWMAGSGTNCAATCGGSGNVFYARAKNLMKAGLTEERAWRSACNRRGPWWNSGARHMNQAFPKTCFDRLGLVSLLDTMQRLQCASMNRRMRNRTSGGVGGRQG